MAKKKQRLVYNYKKVNVADTINKKEFAEYLMESKEVYFTQEAFYDDGTQSFTIQVHFTAKIPKRT